MQISWPDFLIKVKDSQFDFKISLSIDNFFQSSNFVIKYFHIENLTHSEKGQKFDIKFLNLEFFVGRLFGKKISVTNPNLEGFVWLRTYLVFSFQMAKFPILLEGVPRYPLQKINKDSRFCIHC